MTGIWVTPPHLLRDGCWDEIRALACTLVRILEDAKKDPRRSDASEVRRQVGARDVI